MATPTVYEPQRLITPQDLVAVPALLYTSPGNYTQTQITEIVLTNIYENPVTATVYIIPYGYPIQGNNTFTLINGVSIPNDGTPYILEFAQLFLNPGDVIMGQASLANQVSIQIYGALMGLTSTSTSSTSTSTTTSTTTSTSTSTTITTTSTSTTSTSSSTSTTTSTSTSTSTTITTTSTSTTQTTSSTSSSTTTTTSTSTSTTVTTSSTSTTTTTSTSTSTTTSTTTTSTSTTTTV